MQGPLGTTISALSNHATSYFNPQNYRTTHQLRDIRDLTEIAERYDIIFLDRDCTTTDYHGHVPREFSPTLKRLAPKIEVTSNSSLRQFDFMGTEVFRNWFSVSKVLQFSQTGEAPYLLRYNQGKLEVHWFDPKTKKVEDATNCLVENRNLKDKIVNPSRYNKPDPTVLEAIIALGQKQDPTLTSPRALIVDDRFLTGIIAGNLAGIDTAIVSPYQGGSQPPHLQATSFIDILTGKAMQWIRS